MDEKKKNAAAAELGSLGGKVTSKKYGREHFQKIGSLGGKRVAATLGHEHFQRIGKLGGEKVREAFALARAAAAKSDGEG